MHRTLKIALATVPFLLSVACTNADKGPAETAIRAAEAATETLDADVLKYAPDQVQAFQEGLQAAKAAAAAKDWKAARTAAEGLAAKAAEAVAITKEKLGALNTSYADLSAALPGRIAALEQRLAELSKAKKLPAGVTRDAVASAAAQIAAIEAATGTAMEQGGTDLDASVAALKELTERAAALSTALKVP